MSGENYPIEDDTKILEIKSPRNSVGGPYIVVFKNLEERWAIVAMDWEGKPRLGIRWFWGNGGNPFSSGNPTWLVIPSSLSRSILAGLTLDHKFSSRLDDYLIGRIVGAELAKSKKLLENPAEG
jgi:hypothetical protein